MARRRAKEIMLVAHRWLGLIFAPIFAVILISGAILAVRPILNGFGPEGGQPKTATGDPAVVVRLLGTVDPRGRANVTIDGNRLILSGRGGGGRRAFDLRSGQKVPIPPRRAGFFRIVRNLHSNLLVGAGLVIDIASYVMVGLLVIGPLLAWPRLRNTVLGWHIGIGWWLFPLLVLTPLTGVLLSLHLGAPGGQHAAPRAHRGNTPAVTPARAIDTVARRGDLSSLVSARIFRGRDVLVTGRTASGNVTYLVTADTVTRMRPGGSMIRRLHLGTWAGAWSGALNLLSALALIAVTGTGTWSWVRRRHLSGRAPADEGADILIAFASQTGTAARLAQATTERLIAGGERAVCGSLATIDPASLARYRQVLIIASTTGDGAVPDQAAPFLNKLERTRTDGAPVALLGLGDSRYPRFCAGAEALRDALLAAGAHETVPMARADGNPADAWNNWVVDVANRLQFSTGEAAPLERDRIVTLALAERKRLDRAEDPQTREAWSVVLVSEEPLDYRPGDLVLIAPEPGAPERCYSIASTMLADPRRIELTIGLATWIDGTGEERLGAVSGRLCRFLPLGTRIEAALRHHTAFNLPSDPERPVIMIGTGCGVAPFIGFLAEIEAARRPTPAWLIFGNRRASGDFFHRERIEHWRARGVLTRFDTAFSRDESDGAYVQDRIVGEGREMACWLDEKDAVLYVCGRATTLRSAIAKALFDILVTHADLTPAQAQATIETWESAGKIRWDLFD